MRAQTPEFPDHDGQTIRPAGVPLKAAPSTLEWPSTGEGDGEADEDLEIPTFLRRPANPMFGSSVEGLRPAQSIEDIAQAKNAVGGTISASNLPGWASAVDWAAWGVGLARNDLSMVPAWIVKELRKFARSPQVLRLAEKYGVEPRVLALAVAAATQLGNHHAGRVARHLIRGKDRGLLVELTSLLATAMPTSNVAGHIRY